MTVIKIVFLRKREYTEKASRSGQHVEKLQEACFRALSTKIQAVSHSFIQNTAAVPTTGDLWEMRPSRETRWETLNMSQIHRKHKAPCDSRNYWQKWSEKASSLRGTSEKSCQERGLVTKWMEEKAGILNTGKGKSLLQKLPENSSLHVYGDSIQNSQTSDKPHKRLMRRKEGRHLHTGKGTPRLGRKHTKANWAGGFSFLAAETIRELENSTPQEQVN